MKYILVFLLVVLLGISGYYGYQYIQGMNNRSISQIEFLKQNQDMIVNRLTELSTVITKVVNDTAKVQTIPEVDKDYQSLKERILELEEDKENNKEEIAELKEDISAQRQAFLGSESRILVKDKEGDTLLLYRDSEGDLQPASDNIDKIIEHKDIPEPDKGITLPKEEIAENGLILKAGGYYSLDNNYGLIISAQALRLSRLTMNGSILAQSTQDISVGADIGYEIRDNLELGVGYNTDKEIYFKLQYTF